GPVARIGDGLVRPHDLLIATEPTDGAVEAQVERVVHLGFEVRVELETAQHDRVSAQLTRSETEQLELQEGDIVYVRSDGTRTGADAAASAA
ncbi:MAG: sulfate/thiosulfate transport system ATP-binding protein, partial [Baekduia sp.]|nr:sulfate/thiosulfate transport system ATP-binding protein [Baekduia sp.]